MIPFSEVLRFWAVLGRTRCLGLEAGPDVVRNRLLAALNQYVYCLGLVIMIPYDCHCEMKQTWTWADLHNQGELAVAYAPKFRDLHANVLGLVVVWAALWIPMALPAVRQKADGQLWQNWAAGHAGPPF